MHAPSFTCWCKPLIAPVTCDQDDCEHDDWDRPHLLPDGDIARV